MAIVHIKIKFYAALAMGIETNPSNRNKNLFLHIIGGGSVIGILPIHIYCIHYVADGIKNFLSDVKIINANISMKNVFIVWRRLGCYIKHFN